MNEVDRKLLELSAKAAGLDFYWSGTNPMVRIGPQLAQYWNPLADDGDVLRLAVKLGLYLEIDRPNQRASALPEQDDMQFSRELFGTDPCAAMRRAIVRAAAAIGEAMP